MIIVDKSLKTPIYEQIEMALYELILSGKISPGQAVPSVRRVAKVNGINPNTVQKAYAELIRAGAIYSVAGKGNYISEDAKALKELEKKKILNDLRALAKKAKTAGIWMDEMFNAVDSAYSG